MTLIEVLAGLAILGAVLASLSIARGRLLRQWADADKKLAATRIVDSMMSDWLSRPPSAVPVPGQGATQGMPNTIWRTRWLNEPLANELRARAVRLEVLDTSSYASSRAPILSLDFLLHDSRRDYATTGPSEGRR